MNGRIERDGEIAYRSYGPGRDGGAELAEWRDRQRDRQQKPGMYETWQEVTRKLGSVLGLWILFWWFLSMMVRQSEVQAWEIAGLITGLVVVSALCRGAEGA